MKLTNEIRTYLIKNAFEHPHKTLANSLAPVMEEIEGILKSRCPKDFIDFIETYKNNAISYSIVMDYRGTTVALGTTKYYIPDQERILPTASVRLQDVLSSEELPEILRKVHVLQEGYSHCNMEYRAFCSYVNRCGTDAELMDRYPVVKPHLDEILEQIRSRRRSRSGSTRE